MNRNLGTTLVFLVALVALKRCTAFKEHDFKVRWSVAWRACKLTSSVLLIVLCRRRNVKAVASVSATEE